MARHFVVSRSFSGLHKRTYVRAYVYYNARYVRRRDHPAVWYADHRQTSIVSQGGPEKVEISSRSVFFDERPADFPLAKISAEPITEWLLIVNLARVNERVNENFLTSTSQKSLIWSSGLF